MSKENVKAFYEALKADKAMAADLQKACEGITEADKAVEAVIAFGKAKGFDFTADDLKAFESEAQELNAKDLDKVNAADGGGFCIGLGVGMGTAVGAGATTCTLLGLGVGVSWR